MSASEGKKSFVQLVKFGLIGVSNTLVTLIVVRVLQALFGKANSQFLSLDLPWIVGYACGILNSYVWNSRWTFREERRRDMREIVLFIAVNLVTLGLSIGLTRLFKNVCGLDAWLIETLGDNWFTKLISGDFFCTLLAAGITLIVNFIGNKLLVFKGKKEEPKATDQSDRTEEPTEKTED